MYLPGAAGLCQDLVICLKTRNLTQFWKTILSFSLHCAAMTLIISLHKSHQSACWDPCYLEIGFLQLAPGRSSLEFHFVVCMRFKNRWLLLSGMTEKHSSYHPENTSSNPNYAIPIRVRYSNFGQSLCSHMCKEVNTAFGAFQVCYTNPWSSTT